MKSDKIFISVSKSVVKRKVVQRVPKNVGNIRKEVFNHLRTISLPRVHSHQSTNFNKTAISQYLDELQKMTTP